MITFNSIYAKFVAEKFLTYAFERCHKNCRNNKRLILIYLIPVKMLLVSILVLWHFNNKNMLKFFLIFRDIYQQLRYFINMI